MDEPQEQQPKVPEPEQPLVSPAPSPAAPPEDAAQKPEPVEKPKEEKAEPRLPTYTKSDLPELRRRFAELRRSLGAVHQQKEQAFGKRKQLDAQISALVKALQGAKQKRDALTKEVKVKKAERSKASKNIKQQVSEVKKLSEERQRLVAKHKIRGNPHILKQEIAALEYKIETQALPFSKEQELMKVIKDRKKQLAHFKDLSAVFERVRQIDQQLRELRHQAEGAHREVQAKAGASQREHEELLKDAKLLRELRTQRRKLNTECTKLKTEFAKGNAEFKIIQEALEKLGAEVEEEHREQQRGRERMQKLSLAQRGKLVEEKLRKGGKLTTEDLLILQGSQC